MSDETPYPVSVWFWANGMAMVFDQHGQQMPELQGEHAHTVRALAEAGHDWQGLWQVRGRPGQGVSWNAGAGQS